ncbi:MAG: hypothetical protein C4532_09165 [Candidatus Abyssobacteria bacterium SURF_17]|uniref:Dockerin domain-containing protein n=1 Tax=Candidatus Abyssobacteria bacterium SURF_17 TaxID=2093361 RepID=A0A419EZ74_9BACT|nr:MAG: hypothetical protein C4532_09165 [Candidatus Abyssubacteria bacterium SURF_17]
MYHWIRRFGKIAITPIACLVVVAAGAAAQAPDLQAPYSQNVPTIDGVISGVEWGDAASYELTFTHYLTSNTQPMPIWLLNDGTFLYVAAQAPFASDPYFWYGLYLDGDHSHTLHGSATEPHITVDYNKAGTTAPVYSYYDEYRIIQAGCATVSVDPPEGADHAFSESGIDELSFEFKVPLSDLTAEPGETIGFSIALGVNSTSGNAWTYPGNNACDPALWANLTLDVPPSSAAFCEDFEDENWSDNWQSVYGSQSDDAAAPHSGNRAIRMYGVLGNPGSIMYRKDFEATTGVYSLWFRHDWSAAEPRLYVMVDPNGTNDLVSRESYYATFSAQGSELETFRLFRIHANGEGVLVGEKQSTFPMHTWVRGYIKIEPDGNITAGYEWAGGYDEVTFHDDTPITRPGLLVLFTVAEQADPSNAFDDVGFDPDPNGSGCTPLSTLVIPSLAFRPCDSCSYALGPISPAGIQPVACTLDRETVAATVSLKIPEGVEICGVSFNGLPTESWDYKDAIIKADSGFLTVYLANTLGEVLPVGSTTLFNVEFLAPRLCNEDYFIHWDTALSADQGRRLEFTDTEFNAFVPVFDYAKDSTTILGYMPGDVNDNGEITIGDLSVMIDCLFITGTCPCTMDAFDANGSCTISIGDIAILIDHLFINGTLPRCGCYSTGGSPTPKTAAGLVLESTFENGLTTISLNTPVAVRGVQLELHGGFPAQPQNLLDGRLDLVYGQTGSEVRIGLIDLDAGEIIAAGTTPLLRLPGEYHLISASASDLNHVDLATARPRVVGRTQQPDRGPATHVEARHPNTGLDHAVPDGDEGLAHHLARRVAQGVAPLIDDARAALLLGDDPQGLVARLAGDVGNVHVLVLVELQLAVAPAPAAVAGELDPVVEAVEVLLPDQAADLGACLSGGERKHERGYENEDLAHDDSP